MHDIIRSLAAAALACAGLVGPATAATADFHVVYDFPRIDLEGDTPDAPLMRGVGPDGRPVVFGTARLGGAANGGTIFSIDGRQVFTTLASLRYWQGKEPGGPLVQLGDGSLMGTAQEGGKHTEGTVFRLFPTGILKPIHVFSESADGIFPSSPLPARDGWLYGTTASGVAPYAGTLYRIAKSGAFELLHVWGTGVDQGAIPSGRLMQAANGDIIGTTRGTNYSPDTGASGPGTVYRYTGSGMFSVIGVLPADGHLGWNLATGVVDGGDGWYYGTAGAGGAGNAGTFLRVRDADGAIEMLHDFDGTDGRTPSPVTRASDGRFYGVSYGGGVGDAGTAWRIDAAGQFELLSSFKCRGLGCHPTGGVLELQPGSFVGAASFGGIAPSWGGTIYRMDVH